jgi:hypothetical protein
MRYALVVAGAAAVVLLLGIDLTPLRAGVDSPPFSVTVPFDPYTVVLPGAGGSLRSGSSQNTLGPGYMAGGAITTNTYDTCGGYKSCANYTGTSSNHAITAWGAGSGLSVTTAPDGIFIGADAGNNDDGTGYITGPDLVGIGVHTLGHTSTAGQSVALGNESMVGCGTWSGVPGCPLLTGGGHTALGDETLAYIQGAATADTAAGASACKNLTTGNNMVCIGALTGTTVQTSSNGILIGNPSHLADVPSDPTNDYLSIGGAGGITGILGTSLQLNVPVTAGTWNGTSIGTSYGGTGSTASTAVVRANGATEVDIVNSNGGRIATFNTSDSGATTCDPVLSGGGGTVVTLNADNGGGTGTCGGTSGTVQVKGQQSVVVAKTANYTVTPNDSGNVFSNAAATGEVDFTLPTPVAGFSYTFVVAAAQTLKVITPSGTNIAIDTSNSASGGNITASAVYTSITLVAISTTQWVTRAAGNAGSWTVH